MKLNRQLKIYRRWLILFLFVNIVGIFAYGYYLIDKKIPDEFKVPVGTTADFDFGLPLVAKTHVEDVSVVSIDQKPLKKSQLSVDLSAPFAVQVSKAGAYRVDLEFLGIPLKKIDVQAVERKRVMPVGAPVGIHVKTKGIMVLGTGVIRDPWGNEKEPAKDIIKSGDYIQAIDGVRVSTIGDMTRLVAESCGSPLMLSVLRENRQIDLQVVPVMDSAGEYKAGIWIRDDTQGIGTLSFVDENNHFAALGHGITDVDTSLLIDIDSGSLFPASIASVVKGADGRPGEMVGSIYYGRNNRLGYIGKNTASGIFGRLADKNPWSYDAAKSMEIGLKQELHVGAAFIRCCVDGVVADYEIQIKSVDYNNREDHKDFIIEITDPGLLGKTNGIVQGMSGSPIIQDGKLVGVTTHVFFNDCHKGYGIFIESMLEQ